FVEPMLHCDSGRDRADRRIEHSQHRITCHVDHAPLRGFDLGAEDASPGIQRGDGPALVRRHQARKAGDVGGENCGEALSVRSLDHYVASAMAMRAAGFASDIGAPGSFLRYVTQITRHTVKRTFFGFNALPKARGPLSVVRTWRARACGAPRPWNALAAAAFLARAHASARGLSGSSGRAVKLLSTRPSHPCLLFLPVEREIAVRSSPLEGQSARRGVSGCDGLLATRWYFGPAWADF